MSFAHSADSIVFVERNYQLRDPHISRNYQHRNQTRVTKSVQNQRALLAALMATDCSVQELGIRDSVKTLLSTEGCFI